MRWLRLFLVLALLSVSRIAIADPYEVNPYHEELVVEAFFGEAEEMFAPHSEGWGLGEVGGFGPFAVGDGGMIYIADRGSNTVKIFDSNRPPHENFIQSVSMKKRRNLVHDLAVYDGQIFWMGETVFGPRRIFKLDPATGDTTLIRVTNSPELTTNPRGKRIGRSCRLVRTEEGIALWNMSWNKCYPVFRGGVVLDPTAQESEESPGLRSSKRAPAIGFTKEKTVTTSGDSTHADIVILDAAGRPERILVRNASYPYGLADNCFLHSDGKKVEGEWREYLAVTAYDGRLLHRTRMLRRPCLVHRGIDIRPTRFRLAPGGSYYELYLTENAEGMVETVRVAKWSAE